MTTNGKPAAPPAPHVAVRPAFATGTAVVQSIDLASRPTAQVTMFPGAVTLLDYYAAHVAGETSLWLEGDPTPRQWADKALALAWELVQARQRRLEEIGKGEAERHLFGTPDDSRHQ